MKCGIQPDPRRRFFGKTWQKYILEDAALFTGDANIVLDKVRELARNRANTGAR